MAIVKEDEIIDLTIDSPSPEPQLEAIPNTGEGASLDGKEHQSNHGKAVDATAKSSKRKRSSRRRSEAVTNKAAVDDTPQALAPALVEDEGSLFFLDVEPVALPPQPTVPVPTPDEEEAKSKKLLLPAHVSVFGSTPVEILAPTTTLEDDSIQILDYDDGKVFHRYWQEQAPTNTTRTMICKNCNGEGHKAMDCPTIICLTCGVRDEHPTRSCPISKVCFNCHMKGHVSSACPNRGTNGMRMGSRFLDCERCASTIHKTNECPTWWRLYQYLSDAAQSRVIAHRNEARDRKLGEGGEAYIADDQWCYSCGNPGHLGDDCEDVDNHHAHSEPSAFSAYNVASGPFYDPEKENATKKNRKPRAKESFMTLEKVPDEVGRRGKDKAKARLNKASKVEDDPDDWFNKAMKPSQKAHSKKELQQKTMQFGDSIKNSQHNFAFGSGPSQSGPSKSLLDRLGDTYGEGPSEASSRSKRSKKRKDRDDEGREDQDAQFKPRRYDDSSNYNGRRHNYRRDSREWDRSRDRGERNRDRGSGSSYQPRYKGGYSR